MKKININGAQLAYRESGSGAPLIFLHAFPLNQTMWDDQVTFFSPKYRVITFDWRGFGESSLGPAPSTMTVFAQDLTALLDELRIDRAAICGLSMGGYAAFSFLRNHPDRISALILSDTRATADNEEGKRGRYEMAELARSEGSSAIVELMIPRLIGATSLQNDPQIAERVKAMIESSQAEGIAQALSGMAERLDSTDLLSQIKCPTLIIVGNEDKLTPPSEAEKMSQAISGSTLEVIVNAGHLPNIEQPEIFSRAILNFLKEKTD
jgi:pimeloyl-ACP methyl ester carboxylesterase